MNRNKKLIRNILILLVYFVLSRYLGGYYFSKDRCERDILRSLYATNDTLIMELPKDLLYSRDLLEEEITRKIYFDPIDKMVSIVGIEKRGIFYHSLASYTEDLFKYNQNDVVAIRYEFAQGDFVLIYRNNPNVYSIEFNKMDNSNLICWNWKENIIGVILENGYRNTCKAFDEQGNLITEIKY